MLVIVYKKMLLLCIDPSVIKLLPCILILLQSFYLFICTMCNPLINLQIIPSNSKNDRDLRLRANMQSFYRWLHHSPSLWTSASKEKSVTLMWCIYLPGLHMSLWLSFRKIAWNLWVARTQNRRPPVRSIKWCWLAQWQSQTWWSSCMLSTCLMHTDHMHEGHQVIDDAQT